MAAKMIVKEITPQTKGGNRRRGEFIRLQERWRAERSYEAWYAQLEWALKFGEITMSDGSDPMEALLDLSDEENEALFNKLIGGGNGEVVPTKTA